MLSVLFLLYCCFLIMFIINMDIDVLYRVHLSQLLYKIMSFNDSLDYTRHTYNRDWGKISLRVASQNDRFHMVMSLFHMMLCLYYYVYQT